MAVIKSGASTDQMSVDATSKAARVTLYNTDGVVEGEKATYRGATPTTVVAAAGAAMFFVIAGSATKTIRVRRIRITGETLTAIISQSVVVEKWSTAPTGGTAVALVQVPLDSADAAATASLVQVYTAAPAEGILVGTIATHRHLQKPTTAADVGPASTDVEFVFGNQSETKPVVLRGTTQAISLAFAAAPATAVTLSVEVEWTEEQ